MKSDGGALARLMMASATRLAAGYRVSVRWASITDRCSGGPVSSSTVAPAIRAVSSGDNRDAVQARCPLVSAVEESEVERPVAQLLPHLGGGLLDDVEADAGVTGANLAQQARQVEMPDRLHEAECDRARDGRGRAAGERGERSCHVEKAPDLEAQALAGGGEGDAARAGVDQFGPQLVLQRAHRCREGGLADAEQVGRVGEAETTCYMVSYFVGGVTGSALAGAAYGVYGWGGVCVLGAVFPALAFLVWLTEARWPLRRMKRETAEH